MRNRRCGAWLFAISIAMTAGAAADEAPDDGQLARFKEKIRQDMANLPNYTCLETIERVHRDRHSHTFKPVDTVRLEVSSVAGKELFAWPGARRFEDRDVSSLVSGGTMGTGMFAGFARNLFVTGKGNPQYGREEKLGRRSTVRYDFHLTELENGFQIRVSAVSETVATSGSFWFDPVSLDLIRLDVHGEAIPYSLRLEEAAIRTFYARTHIGDSDALLPKRSELVLVALGKLDRIAARLTREMRHRHSESTISFDAPPPSVPEVPKPQVREVNLPAGLVVAVESDTAIDSQTAAVGDPLHGGVLREVWNKGGLAVPQGLKSPGVSAYWTAAPGRRRSHWESSSPKSNGGDPCEALWGAGRPRPTAGADTHIDYTNKVLINGEIPGVGIFYIDGASFSVAPGFHMVWRTLARPRGAVRKPR